jgi:hypothetical protein
MAPCRCPHIVEEREVQKRPKPFPAVFLKGVNLIHMSRALEYLGTITSQRPPPASQVLFHWR